MLSFLYTRHSRNTELNLSKVKSCASYYNCDEVNSLDIQLVKKDSNIYRDMKFLYVDSKSIISSFRFLRPHWFIRRTWGVRKNVSTNLFF